MAEDLEDRHNLTIQVDDPPQNPPQNANNLNQIRQNDKIPVKLFRWISDPANHGAVRWEGMDFIIIFTEAFQIRFPEEAGDMIRFRRFRTRMRDAGFVLQPMKTRCRTRPFYLYWHSKFASNTEESDLGKVKFDRSQPRQFPVNRVPRDYRVENPPAPRQPAARRQQQAVAPTPTEGVAVQVAPLAGGLPIEGCVQQGVNLARYRLNGILDCGEPHSHVYERATRFLKQLKASRGGPLVTCLLEGPSGSGKTAMAATISINSGFACTKMISAETMVGLNESSKCAHIIKVFEEAYQSDLSIVILDDIERLLEYVPVGPQFSNSICQTLLVLMKRYPPEGRKMMLIGTTSELGFLQSVGISDAFTVAYHIPKLNSLDAKKVLQQLNVFGEEDVDAAAEAINNIPIKKLFFLIGMAVQGEEGESAEAIYSGVEKIKIAYFLDCLRDILS